MRETKLTFFGNPVIAGTKSKIVDSCLHVHQFVLFNNWVSSVIALLENFQPFRIDIRFIGFVLVLAQEMKSQSDFLELLPIMFS